jgi:hypothetical protein
MLRIAEVVQAPYEVLAWHAHTRARQGGQHLRAFKLVDDIMQRQLKLCERELLRKREES